ncbi:ABC transporter permease [Alteromonas gilva]|uniref:ABC transporter permease n=1 Tax=Alteromonas gilva TaxID=2987522 RepID=A0ABT5L746_9ALTE|nr:ABC transporter permease [Alteromonas gilva]MDC8832893.1 ABC transporter permease [Alteromonas gilva]
MNKIIKAVFKKELLLALRDKRGMIAILFVPLFLMPMMTFIGTFVGLQAAPSKQESKSFKIGIQQHKDLESLGQIMKDTKFKKVGSTIAFKDALAIKNSVRDGQLNIGIIVGDGDGDGDDIHSKSLKVFYNRSIGNSETELLRQVFTNYEREIVEAALQKYDLDMPTKLTLLSPLNVKMEKLKITDERDIRKQFGIPFSTGVLIFMMIFCFLGASSYCFDVTVVERQTGSLETMLMVPQKPSDIVFGKLIFICSTGFVSIFAGLVGMSGFGLLTSLLASSSKVTSNENMHSQVLEFFIFLNSISLWDISILFIYAIPLFVLICTTLMAIGAFVKSGKEGKALTFPLLIIVIASNTIAQLPIDNVSGVLAFVPFVNAALGMKIHFMGNDGLYWLLTTSAVNISLTAIFITYCGSMFSNVRILRTQ